MIKPLDDIDLDMIARIERSGGIGLSTQDIGERMSHANLFEGAAAFLKRARKRGYPIRAVYMGREGASNAFRYVMAPEVEAVVATEPIVPVDPIHLPTVRSTTRRVTGDLGLGSTPGAPVSVAWVSFLDGAGA